MCSCLQAESTVESDRDEGEGEDDLFNLGADATLREWMQKAGVDVDQVGGGAVGRWDGEGGFEPALDTTRSCL